MARGGTGIIGWGHPQWARWQWGEEHGGHISADAEIADGSECDAYYSFYPDGYIITLADGLPTPIPVRGVVCHPSRSSDRFRGRVSCESGRAVLFHLRRWPAVLRDTG